MKTLTERLNIVDGDENREGALILDLLFMDQQDIYNALRGYFAGQDKLIHGDEVAEVTPVIADFGSKIKLKHNGAVTVWFDKE